MASDDGPMAQLHLWKGPHPHIGSGPGTDTLGRSIDQGHDQGQILMVKAGSRLLTSLAWGWRLDLTSTLCASSKSPVVLPTKSLGPDPLPFPNPSSSWMARQSRRQPSSSIRCNTEPV